MPAYCTQGCALSVYVYARLIADDDRLGKTIVDSAAVRIDKRVEHSQTKHGQREDVTDCALDRLTSRGNHPGPQVDGAQRKDSHRQSPAGQGDRDCEISEHRYCCNAAD